jgi:2-amino-4-hydroxy-6-hydroxymethyldihydropteridine diphosphokinase
MVVELQTVLGPYEVLELCRKLEANADRERTIRWGPRTLDADVLIYGNLVLDDVELTLPHPRMWNRAFVMYPLAELAPDLLPEDWEVSVIGQEVKLIES